jgi:iron complex transport system ATP-binding protein
VNEWECDFAWSVETVMEDVILEIKKYSGGYGAKLVLNDISLTICQGEMVGIIGPNGSGKTTLLRAVLNTLKTESGSVLLKGRNIKNLSPREIAQRMAVVSQSVPSGHLKVIDFVLMGRIPYFGGLQFVETAKDEEKALSYCELTDTLRLKDMFLNELSGGERQLASIARALAQEPIILLLDEPISNLDIAHQVSIMDLIKKLNREAGLTVLLVLHDLNVASQYCDRLVLMNNGIIHCAGLPSEVLIYPIIEEVYKTVVIVEKNPLSGKPFVLLVSREEMRSSGTGEIKGGNG